MNYALSLTLALPFDEALAKTRAALAAEGFGIPAEIDTQAVFKNKLGLDTERRLILGACLPQVAYEALQAEPEIALLLPCNVVVREVAGGSEVSAIKPTVLFTLTSKVDAAHADVVEAKLQAALKRLA